MQQDIPLYLSYMYSYPHKSAYRQFETPIEIKPYIDNVENKNGSLYFHIPFCLHKCGFCNLFSKQTSSEELMKNYVAAMRRHADELSKITKEINFTSFAIGGGTPLALPTNLIDELFDIASKFDVDTKKIPCSIETSPEFTDVLLLRSLRDRNIERISIGIQSLNDTELYNIKRGVKSANCHKALEKIAAVNFSRFNVDLIYGIEGQTIDSFIDTIKQTLYYKPNELFLYPLYVRPGTRLYKSAEMEDYSNMYLAASQFIISEGFTQTSMRRFVKEINHDTEYSCGDELMISCGCGGRSYIGDLHFSDYYSVDQKQITQILENYINNEFNYSKAYYGFILNKDEHQRRFIIKNLMFYRGVNRGEFEQKFNETLPNFSELIDKGYVKEIDGFVKLTDLGMMYSDYIGQLFISPNVRNQINCLT